MIGAEKHDKWKRWLADIELDIRNLDRTHFLWSTLNHVFWQKEHPHWGYWAKYFLDTYSVYAVSTIRRQVRHNRDSISLDGLLTDVRDSASLADSAWWVSFTQMRFPVAIQASNYWAARFGNAQGHLDPAKVQTELSAIGQFANLVEIADRRMAHWDKRGVEAEGGTDDITNALLAMHQAVDFLHELILGSDRPATEDYTQVHVEQVFTVPWLQPDRT